LTQYQRIIGGTKGYLKGKGVIKFEDTAPGKPLSSVMWS
jgi:hypothetical protein